MTYNDQHSPQQQHHLPSVLLKMLGRFLAGSAMIGACLVGTYYSLGGELKILPYHEAKIYSLKLSGKQYWLQYGTVPESLLPRSVEGCAAQVGSKDRRPQNATVSMAIPDQIAQRAQGQIQVNEQTYRIYQHLPYRERGLYRCALITGRHDIDLTHGWNVVVSRSYQYTNGNRYVEVLSMR